MSLGSDTQLIDIPKQIEEKLEKTPTKKDI